MPDAGQRRIPLPGLRRGGPGTAAQRAPRTVAGARLGQKPIVTMVLIGINLAFFLVTALQARSAMDLSPSTLYLQGSLIPAEVRRATTGGC